MISRTLFGLHCFVFLVLATLTTQALRSNGDTAQILGQVVATAFVLAGVIYFKNRAFFHAD